MKTKFIAMPMKMNLLILADVNRSSVKPVKIPRTIKFQTSRLDHAVKTAKKQNIFVHLPLYNQNISFRFIAFLLCL
jgi:hypothetical protein